MFPLLILPFFSDSLEQVRGLVTSGGLKEWELSVFILSYRFFFYNFELGPANPALFALFYLSKLINYITFNQYQLRNDQFDYNINLNCYFKMNDENLSIAANLPTGFDDKPIGNKLKFEIPEYAENQGQAMIPEVNVAQKLPLMKRLQSNALKNKRQALEDLYLLVKENAKSFSQYESLIPELLSFSHVSVVDKTLKIILLYIQQGQQLTGDYKAVTKALIQKCLSTEKADKEDIKKSCQQILFWYMENKYQDGLMYELSESLVSKNHKVVIATLVTITNLLHNFGIKKMKNLQPFTRNMNILTTAPKSIAKQQLMDFLKEAHRWKGENFLNKLTFPQEIKTEMEKFSKEYKIVPMEIKRGIKKQADNEVKVLYRMDEQQNENEAGIDVLCNFSSRWVDQVLQIQKWKDKKAALEDFIKKTKVKNILAPKDISHFITLIKRLLAENNINLLLCGFLIAQNLSKGLKKSFSQIAKNISSYIFLKLKDAKPNIVQAAQQTLKSLLSSVGLQDLIQQIKASLDDKAAAMRMQILKFLSNFASKKQPKVMNVLRTLIEKCVKLTEDGSQLVRKEALEFLCNLKKTHGMKFFSDKLKNLDPKKMSILQQCKSNDVQQMMDIEVHNPIMTIQSAKKEQSKMHIEQKIEEKESKDIDKNIIKSKIKVQEVASSIQSGVQSKAIKTVSSKTLNDLCSPSEPVRYLAYQQILVKSSFQDLKPLMYMIKSNSIRQSSPNSLKMLLQIVKKYSGLDPIDLQTLQFIYKHDWKKAKLTLQDFISTNKFTPQANDYIRHNNVALSNSKNNNHSQPMAIQQTSLKNFMKQLQFLLTKMTNPIPQIRIESAQHAIKFLQPLPNIANQTQLTPTNGWNQECINKFCGMVRFRLNECEQVAKIYSQLLKVMIHKGILTRNKGIKTIMQTIFLKLKQKKPFIKDIFQQIANTNPQFLFSVILTQIARQVNEPLIEFIIENNQLFIRNAQLKTYICPFINLIFNSDMNINLKTQLQKILDQIIELNGENVLQTQIKKMKMNNSNVEQYLAKYNISLNSQALSSKNINLKSDRLKIDQDNPWPIFAAPSHVLKLINQLVSLKEPLPTLANPLVLSQSILQIIMDLDINFVVEYSDILFKWVYWRTVIDPQEIVGQILKFTYKIVIAVNIYLSQTEFTVLLAAMINVLQRFKLEYIQHIGDILRSTFNFQLIYKERSLLFWVNLLTKEQNMKRIPVNQILRLITTCYSTDVLTQHLPTLARSPQVLKNQPFLRFLSSNFDHQFLTVSGFRVIGFQRQNKNVAQLKPLLSEMGGPGGPSNMIEVTPQEQRYYITSFQKFSSLELENKIKQINKITHASVLVDAHMKIIYSVIVPFMKKQIPIINVFTYFRELARLFNCSQGLKYNHCLKDLTRILMYFLIDLDQNSIQNKDQITKTVNRIILFILQKSDSTHMLSVLTLLLQEQLKLNANTKIQHLIYKCIGKVVKFPKFEEKWKENILYIINQTNSIFNLYDIKVDHPLIRTIKAIWKNDIIINSTFFNFIEEYFKTQPINQTLTQVFNEVTNNENIANSEEIKDKQKIEPNPIKTITNNTVNKMINMKNADV